ncbi:T9SS type A sorting domain-containing protein [Flavobacterium sp. AS60]|uniref:T9SS type A sorting domain-containing protein n=1 Tax=Flavobacterium anseongense TaxID=2910677 RepID=UPI001F2EDDEE|nr:T9SS type A sorting domain-containing protein [Flavobacterium sp. AS60]MCF6129476.1 T9SS type A sorting domain-containing protein [Flavobacterium sp. AS60]
MKSKLFLLFFIFENYCIAQTPQVYTTFDGAVLNLYKYEGVKTMVLANSSSLNPATMSNWVNAMDGTYNFYMSCTGKQPSFLNATYINNRSTIARVNSTCGAGCGYLGATGIELQSAYFDDFYNDLLNYNQYSQEPFYEFGRNFWFYTNKLQYTSNDPIVTGYAVFMRFMAMEHLGLQGSNFGSWTFTQFQNNVRGLLASYMADPSLNWANTLGIGQGVPGSSLGGTDLFASFCWYLKDTYGECWLQNVWKYAGKRVDRLTTQDAVDNFIIASSLAARTNLTSLFQLWRWPISNNAINYLNSFDYTTASTPIAATCNPSSISNIGNGFDIGLRNVTLANMLYNSAGYTGDNYQYYIDNTISSTSCPMYPPKANLNVNSSYTITVTTGPANIENVRGWIDFNNNGVFQSTELVINSAGTTSNQTHTATFSVPLSAVTDTSLRMRLASDYYSAQFPLSCGTLEYGQTEDFIIFISSALSTIGIESPYLELYPNPVKNVLEIKTDELPKSVKFYDMSGRLLKNLINVSAEINVSDLSVGTYIIVLVTGKNTYRKKILKE